LPPVACGCKLFEPPKEDPNGVSPVGCEPRPDVPPKADPKADGPNDGPFEEVVLVEDALAVVGVEVLRASFCGIVGSASKSDAPNVDDGLNGLMLLPPKPVIWGFNPDDIVVAIEAPVGFEERDENAENGPVVDVFVVDVVCAVRGENADDPKNDGVLVVLPGGGELVFGLSKVNSEATLDKLTPVGFAVACGKGFEEVPFAAFEFAALLELPQLKPSESWPSSSWCTRRRPSSA